jgi:predicted Zn-dependent protease with MMP-like domain
MYTVEYQTFEDMVHRALAALPKSHRSSINNVAILIEDEPSLAQRYALNLRGDQTLFGLYEGVPLNARMGQTKILPDKITLFQKPLERASSSQAELQSRVARTIWHEVAHYYGLNHTRIYELEAEERRSKQPEL